MSTLHTAAHRLSQHLRTCPHPQCAHDNCYWTPLLPVYFDVLFWVRVRSLCLIWTGRIIPRSCSASRSACDWRSISSRKKTSRAKPSLIKHLPETPQYFFDCNIACLMPVSSFIYSQTSSTDCHILPQINKNVYIYIYIYVVARKHQSRKETGRIPRRIGSNQGKKAKAETNHRFSIRSSNFFRCSSSLTSHMCWDVLRCVESCWVCGGKSKQKGSHETGPTAHRKCRTWRIEPKWFHVPMHNFQSCSRDTRVCL